MIGLIRSSDKSDRVGPNGDGHIVPAGNMHLWVTLETMLPGFPGPQLL